MTDQGDREMTDLDSVHVGQIMAATGSTWDDALGAYFRAVADVRFLVGCIEDLVGISQDTAQVDLAPTIVGQDSADSVDFPEQDPAPEPGDVQAGSQSPAPAHSCIAVASVERPEAVSDQTPAEPAAKASRKRAPMKSAATPRRRSPAKPKAPKTVPQPDVPPEGKRLAKAPGKRSRKKA